MQRMLNLIILGLTTLTLLACGQSDDDNIVSQTTSESTNNPQTRTNTADTSAYKTVEWIDLMPKDDLDALMNPPAYITDIEDGSFEDQISSQLQNALPENKDDRYQQALTSTRILPEMDGQAIRIPGFIVPLEFDNQQTVTQFFLVPFFGACIHLPPPPPNQIIFVNYPRGLKLWSLYDPFWISGTLQTSLVENDIATAAYTMQMQLLEVYSD